ncbi:MAG TPA: dTDP-4-dehydrorhamnose reductase [Caldithrix sp.]|nr:dTDP-4-dehydrorhamnose reductase [Caldithrix sp.]
MSKVFITGANGLLGQALVETLKDVSVVVASGVEAEHFCPVDGVEYLQLDITRAANCNDVVKNLRPDFIINSASFTHVDACEEQRELCWNINVKGVENLARVARKIGTHLIHYSTDYVFNGTDGPYSEGDYCEPVGYYGRSKLASENVIRQIGCAGTIVRTCVLYGTGKRVKQNFFLWVLNNLQAGNKITVVTDQFNNPTLVEDLAVGTQKILETSWKGTIHLAGADYLNRYDFARAIASVFALPEDLIVPITSDRLAQKAPRPPRGGLKIDLAKEILDFDPKTVNEALTYLKWKLNRNER